MFPTLSRFITKLSELRPKYLNSAFLTKIISKDQSKETQVLYNFENQVEGYLFEYKVKGATCDILCNFFGLIIFGIEVQFCFRISRETTLVDGTPQIFGERKGKGKI